MALFRHSNRQHSEKSKTIYARYQLAYTAVDFAASLTFVAGSVMYLTGLPDQQVVWTYLIGSVLFAAKPTLRILREIRLYRLGHVDHLAAKAEP